MPEVAEIHGFRDVCNSAKDKRFVSISKSEIHKQPDIFTPMGLTSFTVLARARGKELILRLRDEKKGDVFLLFKVTSLVWCFWSLLTLVCAG